LLRSFDLVVANDEHKVTDLQWSIECRVGKHKLVACELSKCVTDILEKSRKIRRFIKILDLFQGLLFVRYSPVGNSFLVKIIEFIVLSLN
jgi:hypothetical protein